MTTSPTPNFTVRAVLWDMDGTLIESGGVALSPIDHGVTVGDGVFETMKIVDGEAFATDLPVTLERVEGALIAGQARLSGAEGAVAKPSVSLGMPRVGAPEPVETSGPACGL